MTAILQGAIPKVIEAYERRESEQPNLFDQLSTWTAKKHVEPKDDVERRYALPIGTLG